MKRMHFGIQYAFVSINCRLGVKLADDKLKYFSSESELNNLVKGSIYVLVAVVDVVIFSRLNNF